MKMGYSNTVYCLIQFDKNYIFLLVLKRQECVRTMLFHSSYKLFIHPENVDLESVESV